MRSQRFRRSILLISGLALTSVVQAQTNQPVRVALGHPIATRSSEPAPFVLTAGQQGRQMIARAPILTPVSEEKAVKPVEEGSPAVQEGAAGCNGAPCAPYYRNRPYGCPSQQNRIKMYNRMHEPNWYQYYRCTHFGYHPTQWHAWPDGWLNCRHPEPGPHPYDIERPKPSKRILDAERRRQEALERGEPDLLADPLRTPENSQDQPKELPEPAPPVNPGAAPMDPTIPPMPPQVPPATDPMPMPMP